MANSLPFSITGNLTADPELRFTGSGAAVANVTIAHTPRKFNRETNEWEDGETTFMRGSVWRKQAENAAQSLKRGMRVIAVGGVTTRTWETPEGEKRSVVEMEIDEIGPSMLMATAEVTKTSGNGGNGGGNGNGEKAAAKSEPKSNGGGKAAAQGSGEDNPF
ncbi:single-stranded DNA-binding protein [Ornithinimicrobium murale]|uniref:single-stranded DNA-binding protein n=1 Tax=Ornithinimicrobium murale TaxID=1050153 RepID=UPI000E0D0D83|nr:single-stranded DNA-binding protein [Ornithinimicrobium murale]